MFGCWENERIFLILKFSPCRVREYKKLHFTHYYYCFLLRIFGSKESGRDNVVIKMRFSLYFFSIFPGNQTDGRFALRGDTLKMLSLKVLNSRVYLWTTWNYCQFGLHPWKCFWLQYTLFAFVFLKISKNYRKWKWRKYDPNISSELTSDLNF